MGVGSDMVCRLQVAGWVALLVEIPSRLMARDLHFLLLWLSREARVGGEPEAPTSGIP